MQNLKCCLCKKISNLENCCIELNAKIDTLIALVAENCIDDDKVKAWQPHHDYKIGDIVKHGGNNYICIKAHTSEPSNTPDKEPTLWRLV